MAARPVSAADEARRRAQSLSAAGDHAAALAALEEALQDDPANAALANSAGNAAMKAGDVERAEKLFRQATDAARDTLEYALNRAIALSRLDRHKEALQVLAAHGKNGSADPRYCSVRAGAARSVGDLAEAQRWYDASLALRPGQPTPLHGRARVALERGEADATARYEAALAANRQDAEAWLGLAEALEAAGEFARARELAAQLAAQAPHWIAVLRLLAKIRLATGEAPFTAPLAEAERARPADPAIARAHIQLLEQHDLFEQARDVAVAARKRFPDDPHFRLMEAAQTANLGETQAALRLFAESGIENADRWLLEARALLATDDPRQADALLERVLAERPCDIGAWATRDILWRLIDDPRAAWLHGQDGLVRMAQLSGGAEGVAECLPLLHRLHDGAALPLGQSLRGGTQTRGNLFDRAEPELARLKQAILAAVEAYRSQLPPADPTHPLLRHRDRPWRLAGSWSVRLSGGGDHHAAHLHPQGILSSALYCELPEAGGDDPQAGWIELGRPAPELHCDLAPLHTLQPAAGRLALFPSTLYHGTRPFAQGRRLTVAFDVIPEAEEM